MRISREPLRRLSTGADSDASSRVALTLSASGSKEISEAFLTEVD